MVEHAERDGGGGGGFCEREAEVDAAEEMKDAVDERGGRVGAEEKFFGSGGGEDKAVGGEIGIENQHQRIAVRPRGKSPAFKRAIEFFQCGFCACTSAYAR
jgi:hypothetical protein